MADALAALPDGTPLEVLPTYTAMHDIRADLVARGVEHRRHQRFDALEINLAAGQRAGIDFNQDEEPMYSDFGYFAVGLGLTYQVSDNDVSANEIRRIVVGQTLIAYLFGAVILASVINLVAGLG